MADPGQPAADPEPLAATLARPLHVGSNLRGHAGGGTLAYVLPTLAPSRIACLGRPAPSVLETLRRLAVDGRVTLFDGGEPDSPAPVVKGRGPSDVLWIAGAAGLEALADPAVTALLAAAGAVVVDDVPEATLSAVVARLRASGHDPKVLATTWAAGTVRTAQVRPGDAAPPPRATALRPRLARLRASVPRGGRGARDSLAVLAVPGGADRPPAWLLEKLEAVGVDATGRTWRLASPGVYDSQKVLVALPPDVVGDEGLIAKVTRDTRHNARLATEAEALASLATVGPIAHLAIPRIVASGPVGPLYAVVETMLDGQPLPGALRRDDGGRLVARAVDGLIALAAVTARPVSGSALASGLAILLDRYVALHAPSAVARRALERSLDRVASAPTVPVVAQHGDPGTWNLLAMPDGRVGVLDWEAFEPAGPPLWDLWHLLRSVLLDVRRTSLPRRRSSIIAAAFLAGGAGSDEVADATARYRQAIDLDPGLVVPLFAFGWLHRALKESTRSLPADVGAGHYARFAASVIADLDAPGLRRLGGRDPA